MSSSLLHDCVRLEDTETLLSLIEEETPDLNAVDEEGMTALFVAVEEDKPDHVAVLCEAGACPNKPRVMFSGKKSETSPLMKACWLGQEDIVDILLTHGADVTYRRSHDFGLDDDASALDMACRTLRWDVAQMLIDAGADVTSTITYRSGRRHDVSVLMSAVDFGDAAMVELMLSRGADPNYVSLYKEGGSGPGSALHLACRGTSDLETVKVLIKWGADVNAVSTTHPCRTPLHMAGAFGASRAVVSCLCGSGADPWALNDDGQTVMEVLGHDHLLLDSRPSVD